MQLHKCANVGDEFTGITITVHTLITHVYADYKSVDEVTVDDWYQVTAQLKSLMLELTGMIKQIISNVSIDIFKSGVRVRSFVFRIRSDYRLNDFIKDSHYYKFFEDLVYFSLITSRLFDNLNIYSLLMDGWHYDVTTINVYEPTALNSEASPIDTYVLMANMNDNALVLYRNQFHREIYKGRFIRTPDKLYVISDNLVTCINKVQPTVPKTSTLRMLTLREIIDMGDDVI